jgi:hypothetical protein
VLCAAENNIAKMSIKVRIIVRIVIDTIAPVVIIQALPNSLSSWMILYACLRAATQIQRSCGWFVFNRFAVFCTL